MRAAWRPPSVHDAHAATAPCCQTSRWSRLFRLAVLVGTVAPRIEEIDAELAAVSELREKPAGTIRITATEYATDTILLPKIAKLLRKYPNIKVEIVIDYGLTDIVDQRFDAGVRSGEQVASGMIAVRIAPDMRMAVVGSISYFKDRSEPKKPQDLIDHNCID